MNYKIGRDNFALTIFIPTDCKNNCPFCTSKKDYAIYKPDMGAVLESISKVAGYHIPIKDVVITGGEPFANGFILDNVISAVHNSFGDKVNIYINTSLSLKDITATTWYINTNKYITGINISRHLKNYFSDTVADSCFLRLISKPKHINCVLYGDYNEADLLDFVNEYGPYGQVTFRADYRTITTETLHSFNYPTFNQLDKLFGYQYSSGCHVCNTDVFGNGNIVLHRGTEHSHLEFNTFVEINDLIIKQNGEIRYDWDEGCIATEEILKGIGKEILDFGDEENDVDTRYLSTPAPKPKKSKKKKEKSKVEKIFETYSIDVPSQDYDNAYSGSCGWSSCGSYHSSGGCGGGC